MIPDREKAEGGLWLHRNANGTQTVISGADILYDYNKT